MNKTSGQTDPLPADAEPGTDTAVSGIHLFLNSMSRWAKSGRQSYILSCTLLAILLAYGSSMYLTPGHTYDFDGNAHTARIHMVHKCLEQGHWPLWSNDWYCGYPLMQFYSPLYFLAGGLMEFLTAEPVLAAKITMYSANIISGISVYLLAAMITGNPWSGVLAGIIYALAPWHLFQLMGWGRHPVSLIYALLPVPLLAYECFRNRRVGLIRAAVFAGFAVCLLILAHYGYAVFCVYLFLICVVLDGRTGPAAAEPALTLSRRIGFIAVAA